jgi:plastocyanin
LKITVSIVVIAALLAAVACGGDEETSDAGSADVDAVPTEVEVAVTDFAFAPTRLTGSVGQDLEVTLTNTGEAPHTFTIDEYNVDVEVAAGDETTVTVLPSEPGEFNYYCRFHESQGMLGAITTAAEGAALPEQPTDAADEPTEEPSDDPLYDY